MKTEHKKALFELLFAFFLIPLIPLALLVKFLEI
jgi:hypothetical protein